MSSSSGLVNNVSTSVDTEVGTVTFPTFGTDIDSGVNSNDHPTSVMDLDGVNMIDENNSNLGSVTSTTLSPRGQENLVGYSGSAVEVSAAALEKSAAEQSNVCKVS